MARRISGNAVVIVHYKDDLDKYAGRIIDSLKRSSSYRFVIYPPQTIIIPVDSPEAYDDAAKAALAFAEEDGHEVNLDYDESGNVMVFRNRMAQDRWYEGRKNVSSAVR